MSDSVEKKMDKVGEAVKVERPKPDVSIQPTNPKVKTLKDKILQILEDRKLKRNVVVCDKVWTSIEGQPNNMTIRDKVASIIYNANQIDFSHALELANKIMNAYHGNQSWR